jgi:glucokinase
MIGAVDIGGTKIAVGMVTESGRLLARTACPTAPERGLGGGLARIAAMLRQTSAEAGGELQGIGIGCTGPVNPQAGTIGNVEFLPGWEGADLAGELSGVFGVPVAIENDADAVALGEAAWGAGRGARSFVYVTVGTGIGGGLVLDGKLYRGVTGAHPEIGHHVVDPAGPACFCGAHGCWESLASGPAMVRWTRENAPASDSPAKGGGAQSIFAAAERSEPHALAAVAREGFYLGLGLANLITLFTPEVIALGGGVMRSCHLFWGTVQATIRATCGLVPFEQVRLIPATLGSDTGLVGAACAWLYRYRRDALGVTEPVRRTL